MKSESRTAKRKAYRKASSESLTDAYVRAALKMPFTEIPPALIEMKREQLQIYRATKQLNQAIKERKKASRLTD